MKGTFDIYLCFDSIADSDFDVVILLVTKDSVGACVL